MRLTFALGVVLIFLLAVLLMAVLGVGLAVVVAVLVVLGWFAFGLKVLR